LQRTDESFFSIDPLTMAMVTRGRPLKLFRRVRSTRRPISFAPLIFFSGKINYASLRSHDVAAIFIVPAAGHRPVKEFSRVVNLPAKNVHEIINTTPTIRIWREEPLPAHR
jgi:hypothetical protein